MLDPLLRYRFPVTIRMRTIVENHIFERPGHKKHLIPGSKATIKIDYSLKPNDTAIKDPTSIYGSDSGATALSGPGSDVLTIGGAIDRQ